MVGKCCVPYCRGNYDKDNKVSVFKFPDDEALQKIWLQRVSRENFNLTKNSKVSKSIQ